MGLYSPSPAKSSFTDDMDSEDPMPDNPCHAGCVRFTPNQPQMITLDSSPEGTNLKEARKEFVFR